MIARTADVMRDGVRVGQIIVRREKHEVVLVLTDLDVQLTAHLQWPDAKFIAFGMDHAAEEISRGVPDAGGPDDA